MNQIKSATFFIMLLYSNFQIFEQRWRFEIKSVGRARVKNDLVNLNDILLLLILRCSNHCLDYLVSKGKLLLDFCKWSLSHVVHVELHRVFLSKWTISKSVYRLPKDAEVSNVKWILKGIQIPTSRRNDEENFQHLLHTWWCDPLIMEYLIERTY